MDGLPLTAGNTLDRQYGLALLENGGGRHWVALEDRYGRYRMTFLLITKKSRIMRRSRKAWEWWIEETSRGTFQFCSDLASATYKKDPCALEREADSAFHSFPSSSLNLSLFVSVGSKNPFSEYVIVATEISQISSLKSWLYLHIFLRFFFKRQQTSRSKFRYKWTQTPVLSYLLTFASGTQADGNARFDDPQKRAKWTPFLRHLHLLLRQSATGGERRGWRRLCQITFRAHERRTRSKSTHFRYSRRHVSN